MDMILLIFYLVKNIKGESAEYNFNRRAGEAQRIQKIMSRKRGKG